MFRPFTIYAAFVTAALLALTGSPARAQFICSTILTNTTCTNFGTTTGFSNSSAAGVNNSAINYGAVNASGAGVTGIFTQSTTADASTTNFGTVSASAAYGIFTQALTSGNAVSSNSGSVSATGAGNIGIFTQADTGNATATNSGTVSTNGSGNSSNGIYTQTNNGNATTNNSGTVNAVGGYGIFTQASTSGTAATINSGTVSASGAGNIGIFTQAGAGNATTINSGTVSVSGAGTTGILLQASGGGTSTLINSGRVNNPGGLAIQFLGGPDTLTLMPGSFIAGSILLAGAADTVNINAGNQNLTFNTLASTTVVGGVPYVVSGNRIASVDPTAFATVRAVLTDFSRGVSTLVPSFDNPSATIGGMGPMGFAASDATWRIDEAFASIPGLSAYAADRATFKNATVARSDGTMIWSRGFAGQHIQQADGVIQRNSNTFLGGAIGGDKQVRPNLRVGAFIGVGNTRTSIDTNLGGIDSDVAFGGVYARYLLGPSFINAALQGGFSRNNSNRNINNNLATGGLETATASYNGWYFSPELTYGRHFGLGHVLGAQHTLTPSLQVRYVYGTYGGYSESGSTSNLTVASQTVQNLEERAELKLTRTTMFSQSTAMLINFTGGMLGVERIGGTTINAALLGQPLPFATPGKSGVWGGFGGAGMTFRNKTSAIFASGEYLSLSDSSSVVSGKVGLNIGF